MRRLSGALALGVLLAASLVLAPAAAAQSYGPGLDWSTWYGPYASPIGATGFGSTGYGCGLGAYGFSAYGYGTMIGVGPGLPYCGGFGNYPYFYPFFVGYPFANAVGAGGALALARIGNPNPFYGTTGCDALALGGLFAGQPTGVYFPGAAGQFAIGNNVTLFNLTSPVLGLFTNFGTLGGQNLFGCVALR
jgi:hypothetical protein